jgi:hypothetical protein
VGLAPTFKPASLAQPSLFSVETPVPLRDTTEHEKGIPLIINNLLLFSG